MWKWLGSESDGYDSARRCTLESSVITKGDTEHRNQQIRWRLLTPVAVFCPPCHASFVSGDC